MQVRLKHWPWIHSRLPRGRVCGGGKSTLVQKLVLCLGKYKNFQKQKPPSYRKVSILIFHMARHFLGNNTASVLHTVSIIFCSPSPHVPANPAVIAPNHRSLCWPAEATRAARDSPWGWKPSRGSGAAAEPGQPGFPWRQRVPRAGAKSLWMTLCWRFRARPPVSAMTQPCTTTWGCHAAQPRTAVHYSTLLSRKTEKRKYDFCLTALMLTLLILSLALPDLL